MCMRVEFDLHVQDPTVHAVCGVVRCWGVREGVGPYIFRFDFLRVCVWRTSKRACITVPFLAVPNLDLA